MTFAEAVLITVLVFALIMVLYCLTHHCSRVEESIQVLHAEQLGLRQDVANLKNRARNIERR